uniref:Putative secreted peptide n=1 Tax=Anopheles braziliensis TaxID=58242 RepID=A0A2M3ZS73_9DIPT
MSSGKKRARYARNHKKLLIALSLTTSKPHACSSTSVGRCECFSIERRSETVPPRTPAVFPFPRKQETGQ